MKTQFAAVGGIVLLVVLYMLVSAVTYTVDEREQVVVTRVSAPIKVIIGARDQAEFDHLVKQIRDRGDSSSQVPIVMGAGLYFKMPFADKVERFPDTLLEYDSDPEQIVTRDKKVLTIDNFAWWRIEDPLLYRLRVQNEARARTTLDDIIYAIMREELGRNNLIEVIRTTNNNLSAGVPEADDETASIDVTESAPMRERITHGREKIMAYVLEEANKRVRTQLGIEIIDVRIKRAELVNENLTAVFGRMIAERERVSKRYSSEGEKEASIIRSETDKQVQVMLAEAQRQALEIKGGADAEVIRIYAEAFGANPEFYEYIRSLEVIQESTPVGSEIIIGLDSSIYKYLNQQP